LKAITFGVLIVRCRTSKRNENKRRSKSQEQNFLIFLKIYCRESMYSINCLMFIPCISDILEEKTNNMH
jgi:hypothetical protein